MAWYNTGTIALTNGSATVTGSGTNFLVGAQIGEALYAPDGKLYEIQTINSATVITLATTYLGSTASTQGYQIIPTQSLVADLASDVTDLISDFANVRDYAGNGKFNDGAVGTPGITFTQDQDNGLYRIGSNNWALAAGGIKQVDLSATDVEINYAGVKKLASTATGIDVTGSVTADGLTSSGDVTLGSGASLIIDDQDSLIFGTFASGSSGTLLQGGTSTTFDTYVGGKKRQTIASNGDLSLYEDTGTTPKLAWSAANERLTLTGSDYQFGIQQGANQPWYTRAVSDGTFRLHINGTGDIITASSTGIDVTGTVTASAGITATTGTFSGSVALAGSGGGLLLKNSATADNTIQLITTGGTTYVGVNGSAGNRFIGSSAYASTFGTTAANALELATNNTVRMTIAYTGAATFSGSVTASGNIIPTGGSATAGSIWKSGANLLISMDTGGLYVNNSANTITAFQITDEGNVGIGNSTVESTRFAVTGAVVAANIETLSSTAGHEALIVNRQNSDGTAIAINKAGATVGSIGANGGNIYIGQGDTTIMFSASSDAILPKGTGGASRDNSIDLGQASVNRFNDAFITNGVTTGSDGNDKQDIETLSDAEQRVAVACKGLLRKWRWKSAVEEKGDDARIHFGIIAQDLQAAFEAEGLDAGRYAMFMSNTWADEETGEERTRLGIRYHELLAFIIAAI